MALRSISITNMGKNAYPLPETTVEVTEPIKIAKRTLKTDRLLNPGSPSPKKAVSDLAARITSPFNKSKKRAPSSPAPLLILKYSFLRPQIRS